jgi:hypothetical protein
MPDSKALPSLAELLAASRPPVQPLANDEPTWGDTLVSGGLRFGVPIVGGIVGAGLGPIGAAAGGGLGAGLGETLAEAWEKGRGLRKDINPYQIATQSALGAIPMPGVGKGASLAKAVLGHAAQGGVMGGTATAATSLAETGELPDLGELLKGVGVGAAMSGAIGGALHKTPAPSGVPSAVPELEALRQKQAPPVAPSNPIIQKVKDGLTAAKVAYVDQFDPIRQLEKQAEKAGVRFPSMESRPSHQIDVNFGGTGGKVENLKISLEDLLHDARTQQLEQPVKDQLNLSGMQHGADVLHDRAATMLKSSDPAVQAEGADLFDKLIKGEALPEKFNVNRLAQSQQALDASLGAKKPQVDALAQKMFDINRGELDRGHQGHLITDAAYNTITSRDDKYVPLTRIMDDATGPHGTNALDLAKQKVLFGLQGSERTTEDPFNASFNRGQEMIKETGRNAMAKSIGDLPSVDPYFKQYVRTLQPGEQPGVGKGVIKYYEQGVPVHVEVPEAISQAMNLDGKNHMPGEVVLGATRGLAQKMMTTLNVPFALKNVIRDVRDTRRLSPFQAETSLVDPRTWLKGPKDLAAFAKEWADAWQSTVKQDPNYRRFLESGASYSTLQKNITPETEFAQQSKSLLGAPFRALERFNNHNEEATKLASFNRAIAAGKSDFEAAVLTRSTAGSPDFAKRGTLSPLANKLFMFFNAQVQGTARNMNSFLNDPKKVVGALASATVANAALYNYNRQFVDADGTLAYDRVNDQDKQSSWVIMLPNTYMSSNGAERHSYLKVPKGHIDRLLHNPVGQAVQAAYGEGNASAGQAALDFVGNVIPGSFNLKKGDIMGSIGRGAGSSLNPAFGVPLALMRNQDMYRNVPIESRHLQDVNVTERYGRTTSPSMIGASKMLDQAGLAEPMGLSPQKLQHAMRSIVPGIGESMLGGVDLALRDKIPLEGAEKLTQMPVIGPIARGFVGAGLDQVDSNRMGAFYDMLAKSGEALKTRALLVQRGNPREVQAFTQDPANRQLIGANQMLQAYATQLSQIRKFREQLTLKPTPDAAETLKRLGQGEHKILQGIDAMMQQLAEKR